MVISNCVINLSVGNPAVFAEMFRVLVPGVRIGIDDVFVEDQLSAAERAERRSYLGCVAGALSKQAYLDGLATAGFIAANRLALPALIAACAAGKTLSAKPAPDPRSSKPATPSPRHGALTIAVPACGYLVRLVTEPSDQAVGAVPTRWCDV